MEPRKRIVFGMSGASGAPLAIEILQALRSAGGCETHLVMTSAARRTIELETRMSPEEVCRLADAVYAPHEMDGAISSGSFRCAGMIVAPCSMKTVAGIACGYSDNLLLRAADVTVKEHRPLVLLVRECPLSAIHLRNMARLAELGVWIVPMVLSYYNRPKSIADMSRQLAEKALAPFGLHAEGCYRWGEQPESAGSSRRAAEEWLEGSADDKA